MRQRDANGRLVTTEGGGAGATTPQGSQQQQQQQQSGRRGRRSMFRRQVPRYALNPRRIVGGGIKATRVLQVACGEAHCVAVDQSGDVWAWGKGSSGQLGHGKCTDELAPVRVVVREDDSGGADTAASSTTGGGGGSVSGSASMTGHASTVKPPGGVDVDAPAVQRSTNNKKVDGTAGRGNKHEVGGGGGGGGGAGRSGGGEDGDEDDAGPSASTTAPFGAALSVDSMSTLGADRRHVVVKFRAVAAGVFHSAAIDVDGDLYTWGGSGGSMLGSGERYVRDPGTFFYLPFLLLSFLFSLFLSSQHFRQALIHGFCMRGRGCVHG